MTNQLPYFSIGQYWRNRFGAKVYKVTVNVAETCPVRNSPDRVCTFCDEWGSASFSSKPELDLISQIEEAKVGIQRRFKADHFLVYFQAYTNTFGRAQKLRERFDIALQQKDIHGLVLGTRPDCLPKSLMPHLQELSEKRYLMVELGAQSFEDDQLRFIRRGHDTACTLEAIDKLHQQTQADIALHFMFGLPGETTAKIIDLAKRLNDLPIQAVKLHNLHVLANTPLAQQYASGQFQPIDLETYRERVVAFLRHLRPDIAIQRLAAHANRHDELIAPDWTALKMMPIQHIRDLMEEHGYQQGDLL